MKHFLVTNLGRLRLLAFLEGVSLLILVFIAMPLKYMNDDPYWVRVVGPVHGVLFILFVLLSINVATEYRWKFKTTLKVIVASFIPFGTFYVDYKILSRMQRVENV